MTAIAGHGNPGAGNDCTRCDLPVLVRGDGRVLGGSALTLRMINRQVANACDGRWAKRLDACVAGYLANRLGRVARPADQFGGPHAGTNGLGNRRGEVIPPSIPNFLSALQRGQGGQHRLKPGVVRVRVRHGRMIPRRRDQIHSGCSCVSLPTVHVLYFNNQVGCGKMVSHGVAVGHPEAAVLTA